MRAFVDTLRSRPCSVCGVDTINPGDDLDSGCVRLEPAPVAGVDAIRAAGPHRVAWGWLHTGRYWRVHRFADDPLAYAFLAHSCAEPSSKGQQRMTHPTPPAGDPFGDSEGRPAVSFKDAPIGTVVTCTIDTAPKLVQARNFESGQPDFWPDGNPKMTAVVDVKVNGEDHSVWAAKPSSLYAAITAAVKQAGQNLAPGGTLSIRLTGEKPHANPRLNAQKLYEAHYVPPAVFANDDQWAPAPAATPAPATPAAATPAATTAPPAAAAPAAGAPPWAQ